MPKPVRHLSKITIYSSQSDLDDSLHDKSKPGSELYLEIDIDKNNNEDDDEDDSCSDVSHRSLSISSFPEYDMLDEELIDKLDESDKNKNEKNMFPIWLMCAFGVALILGFSIGFLSENKDETNVYKSEISNLESSLNNLDNDSNQPSISPTTAPNYSEAERRIRSIVELASDSESLNSNSSPQLQAFNWLIKDDFTTENTTSEKILQRYALAVLYFSTNGEGKWAKKEDWVSHLDECDWYGVKCLDSQDEFTPVLEIRLDRNHLGGTIPPEIGLFEHIESLHLWQNGISGNIPESIGNLASLRNLEIYNNLITGTIPKSIKNMIPLQELSISNNLIQGTLPSEIGHLAMLQGLSMTNNQLSGTIPENIGYLASLTTLYFEDNKFSGPIPSSIGNLISLMDIRLSRNKLFGTLPEEMKRLTKLRNLYLNGNSLEGGLSSEIIKSFANLRVLDVSNNKFVGSIPLEIRSLNNLEYLFLNNNEFNGTIPFEIAEIGIQSKVMTFEHNSLIGTVPSKICSLNLDVLTADCNGTESPIDCSCCTSC